MLEFKKCNFEKMWLYRNKSKNLDNMNNYLEKTSIGFLMILVKYIYNTNLRRRNQKPLPILAKDQASPEKL